MIPFPWRVVIAKYNPNHDRLGRFSTATGGVFTEGVSRGTPKANQDIVLSGNRGYVTAVPPVTNTGGERKAGNRNPMDSEARSNLKVVGHRVSMEELHTTRAEVANAYASLRKPSPGEAAQQRLRDAMGPDGRWERGNVNDRRTQNESVLRRYGDGHTAGCYCCGVRVDITRLSLEKMVPALGYRVGNLAPSCGGCNGRLGNLTVSQKFGVTEGQLKKIASRANGRAAQEVAVGRSYSATEIRTFNRLTSLVSNARRTRAGSDDLYYSLTAALKKAGIHQAGGNEAKTNKAWQTAVDTVKAFGGRVQVDASGVVTITGIKKGEVSKAPSMPPYTPRDGDSVIGTVDRSELDHPSVPKIVAGTLLILEGETLNGKHRWTNYFVDGWPLVYETIRPKMESGLLKALQTADTTHATMEGTMPAETFDGEVTISKVDEKKGLVFGWASVIHKDGEVITDSEGDRIEDEWELEKAAYSYVVSSGDMGDNHQRTGVGRLVESLVVTADKKEALGLAADSPTGWWVGFKIDDAKVMKGFVDKEYSGFSVHGKGRRIEKAAKMTYNQCREALDQIIQSKYGETSGARDTYAYVQDFTDSWVVFTVSGAGKRSTYKASYSLTDRTLSDVEEVVPQTTTTYVTKGSEAIARFKKVAANA